MTEAEWLECANPQSMLEFLQGKASERKLRLFACACSREIWPLLKHNNSRRAVEVTERYVDGKATTEQRGRADVNAVLAAERSEQDTFEEAAGWLAAWVGNERVDQTAEMTIENAGWLARLGGPKIPLCALLRDIFGIPFRPIALNPTWLAWHGGTIPRISQGIYDERAFDRLPILADALEEAGCDNADILNHCRQPGEHYRGCWVVDLLLGKT
jgi:hypothetical protein